jgi:hypothetical protein
MIKHFILFILLSSCWPVFAATLTATPDRTVIGEDETLQLSVRIDEQIGFGGPDFSLLEDHFDILNQHRSNQFRSINGRTEGWTEWNIVLAPKKSGKLLIPSFSFEGAISDAIEITVNAASVAPAGELKELFTEMEVNKDNVYVQEQLLVTYRIFSAIQVREISLAEAFGIPDANVEVVTETNFRKNINSQVYRAYEVIYAIHPQKSGPLTLPGLTWNLVTADSRVDRFNDPFRSARGQMRRLRTDSRTLNVNPKPTNYSGVDWIPAVSVSLEQHWSSDPSRFVVGEPITRTLTLTAKGLAASQLPAIPQIENTNVKVYNDQPQFDETKSREGLTGVRIETSAIVPTQAGEFKLPPVRVTWWDTTNNREQIAELPAQSITVAPASISSAVGQAPPLTTSVPTTEAEEINSSEFDWAQWRRYWPLLASNAVFALLSIIFFTAWVTVQRKDSKSETTTPSDEVESLSLSQVTRELRIACADNNAAQTKQALGHWGKEFFGLGHLASSQDILRHCQHSALSDAVISLDQHLYSQHAGATWKGQALWKALTEFIKQQRLSKSSNKTTSYLKPLYPNAA